MTNQDTIQKEKKNTSIIINVTRKYNILRAFLDQQESSRYVVHR